MSTRLELKICTVLRCLLLVPGEQLRMCDCLHSGPIQGLKEKGKWEMTIRYKKIYASVLIGKNVRGCERDGKAVLEFSEIESHWECTSICAKSNQSIVVSALCQPYCQWCKNIIFI